MAALWVAYFALGKLLGKIALKTQLRGVLISTFLAMMILACLGSARLFAPLETWKISAGPMVLFLGLLTLLNAPFDWVSLGLTRALLRRGLELGGWWPYALALVDAGLAAVVIAALALTIVVGVQAFDGLAMHGGGASVLPLEPLFNGIAAHPTTPEYWWLYALLLSTMIPSLVNLVIGGASLLRGLPVLPSLLLRAIPSAGWRTQMGPSLDRRCPHCAGRGGCSTGDRGSGIPGRVHHRLHHAVLRPGAARDGPRPCRLQPAGAGGAALRGELVASGTQTLLVPPHCVSRADDPTANVWAAQNALQCGKYQEARCGLGNYPLV